MLSHGTDRTSWDLFCRVVDNFGDAGIAWRLAKQLATDARLTVRLFVAGLDTLERIEPQAEANRERQMLDRVEVVRWPSDDLPFTSVAAVVVELLGCGLPPPYLDAMERSSGPSTVWIDYEHLSAESWVSGYHGLPSPHPTRPLVKHFFYPGFSAATGGLLFEPGLGERRAAFLADPRAIEALWHGLGLPAPAERELRLSLFAYDDAPIEALLASLSEARDHRWTVVVPGGAGRVAIDRMLVGSSDIPGSLIVRAVPFVDQDTYDRLLWACDVNFVRGEDSFVRAQAAGRPFVWQIYKQAAAAHRAKLLAFEDVYECELSTEATVAQRALWHAWNEPAADLRPACSAWLAARSTLAGHAEQWRRRLAAEVPLIDRLLAFVASRG